MRRVIVGSLWFLVGCDQVFGLNGRGERDGGPDDSTTTDGSADSGSDGSDRPLCPSTGVPPFAPTPAPIVSGCMNYTTSAAANNAMMVCSADAIFEAPLDSNAVVAADVQNGTGVREPRLSPTNDEMFAISVGNTQNIILYSRLGGQWRIASMPVGLPSAESSMTLFTSPPTTTAAPRLMVHHGTVFSEYERASATWALVRSYQPDELGVSAFLHPSLTPDGLHLVFVGSILGGANLVRYASRPSVGVKFDTSVALDVGIENVLYPHLAADCSTLYFWGNGAIHAVVPP